MEAAAIEIFRCLYLPEAPAVAATLSDLVTLCVRHLLRWESVSESWNLQGTRKSF